MSYQVRLARLEDAVGVCETVKEVYDEFNFCWEPEGYHADIHDLTDYCNPEIAQFWVAESNNEILGCGGIEWCPAIPGAALTLDHTETLPRVAATQAMLIRYYVRPNARGQGIASKILELSIAAAKLRGITGIEIWSDKRFVDAHRLYQNRGAVVVGDRILDDPDESPEWGMYLAVQ